MAQLFFFLIMIFAIFRVTLSHQVVPVRRRNLTQAATVMGKRTRAQTLPPQRVKSPRKKSPRRPGKAVQKKSQVLGKSLVARKVGVKVNNRIKINLYDIDFLDYNIFQFQHFLWMILTHSIEWDLLLSSLTKHYFKIVPKLFVVRLQIYQLALILHTGRTLFQTLNSLQTNRFLFD